MKVSEFGKAAIQGPEIGSLFNKEIIMLRGLVSLPWDTKIIVGRSSANTRLGVLSEGGR